MTRMMRHARLWVAAGIAGTLLVGGQAAAAPGGNGWNSAGGDRQNTQVRCRPSRRSHRRRSAGSPRSGSSRPAATCRRRRRSTASRCTSLTGRATSTPSTSRRAAACGRRSIAACTRRPGRLGPGHARRQPTTCSSSATRARSAAAAAGPRLRQGHRSPAVEHADRDTTRPRSSRSRPPSSTASSTSARPRRRSARAVIPGYPCCSFRGSMAALDLETGRHRSGRPTWRRRASPATRSGAARRRSTPSAGQLYIATGNNYDAPPTILACIAAAGNDPVAQQACLPGRRPLRLDPGPRPEDRRGPVGDASDAVRRVDGGLHPVLRRGRQLPRAGGPRLRLRAGAGAVHGQGRTGKKRDARRGRPEERPVLGARPRHRAPSSG